MSTHVLLVSDRTSEDLTAALSKHWHVETISAIEPVPNRRFELVILDTGFEQALERCRWLQSFSAPPPIIVLGDGFSLHQAIAMLRFGASDLIQSGEEVGKVVAAAAELLEVRRMSERLRSSRWGGVPPFAPRLLGDSVAMQRLRRQLMCVKDSDATVLVTGETGTGKELVARALHEGSRRKDLPFVAVACGAVVPTLLESEFFGYARGAFTGASNPHRGLLRQAEGGTIFLDEISEMPLTLQAKLLRVLQERRVRPLGHGVEEPFSARLIASSSRNLQTCVKNGTFREDLYFRLKVVEVSVPALRDRRSDILMLAQHFIERASKPERPLVGLTVTAARALLKHDWPGNVRELQHCIWAAAASAHYDQLSLSDLPAYLQNEPSGLAGDSDVAPLSAVKRNHILRVLDSVSGNKALASRLLGLDRKTLVRQVNGEGVSPAPVRERIGSVSD